MSFSDTILAVDIGATNLRMRGCGYDRNTGEMTSLWTETDVTGSEETLHETLIRGAGKLQSREGVDRIMLAAIGCPGIVAPDRQSAAITYLGPSKQIHMAGWLKDVGVERVMLYNDLECGCFGVKATPLSQLEMLSGRLTMGVPDTFMVGMPGTGLGVGFWMNESPHPTEGGHGLVTVLPNDPVESQIWHGLCQKDPDTLPVYDDVASGKGLASLARILNAGGWEDRSNNFKLLELDSILDLELPAKLSEWIGNSSASAAKRELAETAFRYFGRFLGRALQIAVLTTLPEALFLAGTIVISNLPYFTEEFLKSFQHHRYHEKWLKRLPVVAVRNPDLNLDGAVEAARRILAR